MMKKALSANAFKDSIGIGIDVSKAELVIVGFNAAEQYIKRVANEMGLILDFMKALQGSGYSGKLICESTGHYHLKLVLACHEVGMEIIVLNPLQSSKHTKAKVRKTKTDPQDGLTLAMMCVNEPQLPKPMVLDRPKILIRLKMGQLAALEKQLQKGQASMNQYEQTYAGLGLEQSELQISLRTHYQSLKGLRQSMEQELEKLLRESVADPASFRRLQAMPGYSDLVCGLVSQLDRRVKDDDSWVAYSGLDISVRESGSWRGKGKLTKRGNAYLRKRLFQAAWGAYMNNADVRDYYDALKAGGRRHTEALCIIARKMLRIAYHVVVNEVEFDSKIAFAQHNT